MSERWQTHLLHALAAINTRVIQNTDLQTQAFHALTSRQLNGTEYANTKVIEMRLTVEISLEQFVIIH